VTRDKGSVRSLTFMPKCTVFHYDFHTITILYNIRIESFEMWCWRKMLGISWKEHRTNISILEEIGLERELMGKLARMKLQYFGHVTTGSAGNLALTVLEGSIDGLRHQGRSKRQWMDETEQWSGCSYIQLRRCHKTGSSGEERQ